MEMDNIGLDEDPARIQNSGVSLQSQYTSLNQASRLQNASEDRGREKIIGKGAFGQVAKGTATDLREVDQHGNV